MTIGSHMNSITGPMPHFFLELEKKNIEFDFVCTLASSNIDQSAPNFVKIYMTNTLQMSSILCLIEPEKPKIFVLEFGKMLHSTLFTL